MTCDVFETRWAARRARVRGLDVVEALDRLYAGTLESNMIALTFDDGYVDNAVNALPVLERHGLRDRVQCHRPRVSGKERSRREHGSPRTALR